MSFFLRTLRKSQIWLQTTLRLLFLALVQWGQLAIKICNPWSTLSTTPIQGLGPHRASQSYCRSDALVLDHKIWPNGTRDWDWRLILKEYWKKTSLHSILTSGINTVNVWQPPKDSVGFELIFARRIGRRGVWQVLKILWLWTIIVQNIW